MYYSNEYDLLCCPKTNSRRARELPGFWLLQEWLVQFHTLGEKKAKSEGKAMFWAAYILPKEFSLVLWLFSHLLFFWATKDRFHHYIFLLFLRLILPMKCLHKSFCSRLFSVPFYSEMYQLWHLKWGYCLPYLPTESIQLIIITLKTTGLNTFDCNIRCLRTQSSRNFLIYCIECRKKKSFISYFVMAIHGEWKGLW